MSRDLRIVKVRDGVIMDAGDNVLDADVADRIARSNGFSYAERFIAANPGQTLQLNDKLIVIARDCRCGHSNMMHVGGSGRCVQRDGHHMTRCDCIEYREAMP